jgi:hypothetical protein
LGAGHGAEAGCSSQSDVDEQRKGYNLITSDYPLSLRGQSDSKPGFLSEWTVGALARVDRTVDRCFCHMYLMRHALLFPLFSMSIRCRYWHLQDEAETWYKAAPPAVFMICSP